MEAACYNARVPPLYSTNHQSSEIRRKNSQGKKTINYIAFKVRLEVDSLEQYESQLSVRLRTKKVKNSVIESKQKRGKEGID